MVDRVLLLIAAIEATGPEMDRHCWQRSSKKKRNCERTTTAKKSFHLCPTFQPVATSLSTRVLSFFFPQFPTTERLFFGFYRVVNRVFFSSSFFLAGRSFGNDVQWLEIAWNEFHGTDEHEFKFDVFTFVDQSRSRLTDRNRGPPLLSVAPFRRLPANE